MKRLYSSLLIFAFVTGMIFAQNEVDALRYSQNFYGGTARSVAMAGSFGALGGDFSSLSINQAGIGVYRGSELTFTPSLLFGETSTAYLGTTSEDDSYKFMVNNLGFVGTHQSCKETGWISWSFGAGYNQQNNFNRNFLAKGVQSRNGLNSSSLLDNFTDNANAGNWDDYYEELAWLTNLMPYDTLTNEYWNDIADGGYGQFQRKTVQESGYLGEYLFSFGANYNDKIYIGASLGVHRLRFQQDVELFEVDDQMEIVYFNSFTFREHLDTYGTGYTFKMGMIFKPINLVRIGAAFHVPAYYRISEDFHTSMESTFDPETGESRIFERSALNSFEYKLRTPYRLITSVAVQIPKIATFNVDCEFLDYGQVNMDSREYAFYDENDKIKQIYSSSVNIRAGGEVRLGPAYLRAGAGYYSSPFKNEQANSDASTIVMAGGLGFRSEKFFLDMGYTRKSLEEVYYLYVPQDVLGANVHSIAGQFVATLGLKF